MIEPRNCSRCGTASPADSPGGHCLPCLLGLGLAGDDSNVPDETVPTPSDATVLPVEKPGDRIGRYKLLQQIGEGGCGIVYMPEQDEPVRRRVALKIIKLGMDTRRGGPVRSGWAAAAA